MLYIFACFCFLVFQVIGPSDEDGGPSDDMPGCSFSIDSHFEEISDLEMLEYMT